ncbi:MAG TPA: efflux RND transporter periplasmic adaptor subunit [Methylibium sp.]|nr:efflux RND transporter periplasmic adaptor subunit [Methylibium sp.]
MKRLHLSVAAIGLVVLSAGAWWWQHRGALPPGDAVAAPAAAVPPVAGPVPVEVARAIAQDLSDDTTAVGSLRSRQGVMVRPEVSGRVVRLGFRDGERVKRGQLLVQLDDALQRAQLSQAEAQLAIARTTLQRNQELVAQNFVTQSVVDQARANVDVAEAQVALARAQLEKLRIVAPFDGQAGIRAVNVGDYLKDGADIVALEDSSSLYVDFSLPERYAARLAPRQPVEVAIDALPGERFGAVVLALEPQITADGRAIAARATVPNADARLRPGMFARVRVVLAERPGAVLVPEEALVPQAGKDWLIKVVDGPQGPASLRVEVRTGLRRDGQVEIVSGLAAGERVVTAGQARLLRADAQPLQVVELGGAAVLPPAPGSAPRPAGGGGAG